MTHVDVAHWPPHAAALCVGIAAFAQALQWLGAMPSIPARFRQSATLASYKYALSLGLAFGQLPELGPRPGAPAHDCGSHTHRLYLPKWVDLRAAAVAL